MCETHVPVTPWHYNIHVIKGAVFPILELKDWLKTFKSLPLKQFLVYYCHHKNFFFTESFATDLELFAK